MTGTQSLLLLLDAFAAKGIPYMVVGSYSSNFYGIPRSTKDADLVVHLSNQDWASLPAILPEGMHLDEQMGFEMVTSSRREIVRITGSPFHIELFRLTDDDHDRSRFERRMNLEIFPGRHVQLPTAEDVIIQKLRWSAVAKRPKDYADTVSVMKMQGEAKLDWPYIEKWCTLHSTMEILNQAKAEAAAAWDDSEE
ncbi:MAG: nucleotidyltransferase family protein [Akkermansiaceae bacterium]|jgi:hypothetical protein|nr:nucleotidyltransferase family protein [Akkermansiaceae bacterium]MDP4646584.1 nucleotidyltransferase family protein [Akkermansiaceae bacterium]MDP4720803.1 nucleotidyltransferase family protein [Akkermansiaceae bacterium]MDP4781138.1 nucleotidyltransferase family protein [Akkermansiaceae bacterium]MDP4846419.1 nucleotidyltransferase family protein [Akkermansiaceae bacterium]